MVLLALAMWFQVVPVQVPQLQCVYRGLLPDPVCTPGAIDPRVTPDTLAVTICVPGYTRTVRPPTSYTTPLKRQQMVLYGVADQPLSAFEEDHLVALELGGAPRDPANLWPEPDASPNLKDQVENRAHDAVCSGELELDKAQWLIAVDWRALGVLLGVLTPEVP